MLIWVLYIKTFQEKSIELEKEKLGLEKQLFTSAEQLLEKEEEMQVSVCDYNWAKPIISLVVL